MNQINEKLFLAPESFIRMMHEIRTNHRELWELIKNASDASDVLAEVGAFLGIMLDGAYSIRAVSEKFYWELRTISSPIILPTH